MSFERNERCKWIAGNLWNFSGWKTDEILENDIADQSFWKNNGLWNILVTFVTEKVPWDLLTEENQEKYFSYNHVQYNETMDV